MSQPKRRIRPKSCVRWKYARLHACNNKTSSPSRLPLKSDGDPSELAHNNSPFTDSDNASAAESTHVGLSQVFDGVAAKKPPAPRAVRKAFLKQEMDEEVRQALLNERRYNNDWICRKPGCKGRKNWPSRCPRDSSVCTEDNHWIDSEFPAW